MVIVQCETKEAIAVQSGTAAEDREHEETENEEDIDEVLDALNLSSRGSESDTDSDSAFESDTDDLAF